MAPVAGIALCVFLSSFVCPSTSLPPPLPEPTPCQLPNGTIITEATPGSNWDSGSGCASCNCPESGGVMECYPPPCPAPPPGGCSNMQFPPGVMCCGTCLDPPPTYAAPPPPPSPPSPAPCQLSNGTVIAEATPGNYWDSGSGCASCSCPESGGVMECYPPPCPPPPPGCSNMHFPPGVMCCGTCLDGPPPPPPPPSTSSPPGPPSTSSPPPTTPQGCWFSNGTQVPGMQPGGSFSVGPGCGDCQCSQSGLVTCLTPPCVLPPCVDPEHRPFCCSTCPNGPNCYGPGGVIIPGGSTQVVNGMECSCSASSGGGGGYHGPPSADCVPVETTPPITTTTPPVCRDFRGRVIEGLSPGGHWKSEDGCTHCYCDQSGQTSCAAMDCAFAMCVDRVSKPGECCYSCPNGLNCETPQGKVIKQYEHVVENGMDCSCPQVDLGYGFGSPNGGETPKAECVPVPTTAPPLPSGCKLYNGTILTGVKPGDKVDLGPCKFCDCGENWEVRCAVYRCARPPCYDAVVPKGKCCAECPNGPDCTRPDGSVVTGLKPGDRMSEGCETCTCDKYGKARCFYMACMMPMCGDAVVPKGGCCAECPNGENCKLYSGKLLPVGESIKENGVVCRCVKDERYHSVMLRCESILLPVLYAKPLELVKEPKLEITVN